MSSGATITDQLGRSIVVGARVVPVDSNGAILWSRAGKVIGLGRALVHVQWSRQQYDQVKRHHAVPGERLRIREA